METPPCVTPGQALNRCARSLYEIEVHQQQDFTGCWSGWKMRGPELISPDGDRIRLERLRGVMLTQHHGQRQIKAVLHGANEQPQNVVQFRRVQHKGG